MNNRIKELAEHAGYKPLGTFADELMEIYNKKFAKLIIQECLKICVQVENDTELSAEAGTFRDGATMCYGEIAAHFGWHNGE